MEENNPQHANSRPRRRKDKDNPYEIFERRSETGQILYFLSFKDGEQNKCCVEISRALFDEFNGFELKDLAYLNEKDRHLERSELTDESVNRRAVQSREPLEELVFRQIEIDALRKALAQLPRKQYQRLALYYFEEFTYEQIAEMEGCSFQAVAKTVSTAIKNLKKIMNCG